VVRVFVCADLSAVRRGIGGVTLVGGVSTRAHGRPRTWAARLTAAATGEICLIGACNFERLR
jgi:hypothetical protein